jgi:hypothetical protein
MVSLVRLQERVAGMMLGGESLDRVEAEIIEPSALDPERKAALWLFAWSFLGGQEQRAELARHLVPDGD